MVDAEAEFRNLISKTNFRVAANIRQDFLTTVRELRLDSR